MRHPRCLCPATLTSIAVLAVFAYSIPTSGYDEPSGTSTGDDPVVARVYEHLRDTPRPIVLVVGPRDFPPAVWNRVKNLVAFRLHRATVDGTTLTDAAVYLVRDSDVYFKAAATLRNRTTNHEYVWCLLSAVLMHESAHTVPKTERQALMGEAAQLRRCLSRGHLYSGDGWSAGRYLQQVEAKLRNPHEHY
jgi:hypothetical protein